MVGNLLEDHFLSCGKKDVFFGTIRPHLNFQQAKRSAVKFISEIYALRDRAHDVIWVTSGE